MKKELRCSAMILRWSTKKKKSCTKQVHRASSGRTGSRIVFGTHWATGDMMIEGKRATESVWGGDSGGELWVECMGYGYGQSSRRGNVLSPLKAKREN